MEAPVAATGRRIIRLHAAEAVTLNPARLHRVAFGSEVPSSPTPFVVVAWGSEADHALAARRRAEDFAYDNRLHVVNHVVSHCPRVRDATLYDVASAEAVYRSATYDMVWWLLTAASHRPESARG